MAKIVTDDGEKISALPSQVRFDPELLTFVELKKTASMTVLQMLPTLEKCITGWGYDTPFKKGALQQLELDDSGYVAHTILEGIGEDMLKRVKGVKVDFRKGHWTADTLEKLRQLELDGDFSGMVDMFREVCEWSGGEPSEPMNCIDGGAAYKAIMDKWNGIVSGKN